MDSISKTIGIILSIVFALIVVLPVLFGLVRGAKKSAFRLIWVVCLGILSFSLVGIFSKILLTMDISSLNVVVAEQQATTIPQAVELFLKSADPNIAQTMADNPEILNLLISLVAAVFNLFVLVIVFWALKWLLWPIWAIIAHFVFKNKNVETKKVLNYGKVIAEKQTVVKQKRYALLGGVFGLVMGLFTLGITMIPIAGISDTLARIEEVTLTEQSDGSQQGLVSKSLGENANLIYCYSESPAGKVLGAVGVNKLEVALAKSIASTKSDDKRVSALDEIVDIASLSIQIETLQNYDYVNLTKEEWVEVLPKLDTAINVLMSSGIVRSLYDNLVPYFIENILNTPDYFIKLPDLGNEILNNLVKEVLLEIKDLNVDDIKSDIRVVLGIAQDLNSGDLLTEIAKNNLTLDYVQQHISTELGESINEKLFSMKTVANILPICLTSGVEYACTKIGVEYVKAETDLTAEQTKTFFKTFINDVVEIVKNWDSTANLPVSYANFVNVGNILDSFKQSGIVTTQTFNNLVDYAAVTINTEIDNLSIDASISTLLKNLVSDIGNIGNYKNEFTQFGLAYKTFVDENVDLGNMKLKSITKILDQVLPTYLYQYNVNEIMSCIKDVLKQYCSENGIELESSALDSIVESIKYIQSYETEYLKAKDLIDYLEQILANGDLTSQLSNVTAMTTLGEKFDETVSNLSIILKDENCKLLLKSIIKNVELPAELVGTTIDGKEILVVMSENVDNITSYKSEFANIATLLSIKNVTTLSQYGDVLDSVKQSVLLNNILPQVVKDKITEKADTISNQQIKGIVNEITDNVDKIQSYKIEFEYLDKILQIDFDTATLRSVGQMLDDIKNSVLLDGAIDKIILLQIDENTSGLTDQQLKDIIEKVKLNVSEIENYTTEFGFLQQFVDLDVETASMTQFGVMLNDFVDSVLFGNVTNDILSYALEKGEAQIDSIYSDIYNEMLANVNNISGKIYEQELNYVQTFIDFTNNGEIKSQEKIQTYLNDNILDSDGNSQSVLIDDDIVTKILQLAII